MLGDCFMENYMVWLKEQGKRENTIKQYETTLKEFIQWYEDTNGVVFQGESITPMDLQEWKQFLMEVAKQIVENNYQFLQFLQKLVE